MTSTLPLTVDLDGTTGRWLWVEPRGVVPVGVILDHGDHNLMVCWATYAGGPPREWLVTLESLLPLTVAEPVRCGICRTQGRIVGGAWLPSEAAEGGVAS